MAMTPVFRTERYTTLQSCDYKSLQNRYWGTARGPNYGSIFWTPIWAGKVRHERLRDAYRRPDLGPKNGPQMGPRGGTSKQGSDELREAVL